MHGLVLVQDLHERQLPFILLWTFSYIFRVFTKNMTYSTQLKQYEDAVIAKRFEELQDDEVEALLGEIEREGDL